MSVQQTSLDAYYNTVLPTLGEKQADVLSAIIDIGPATNSEIADYMDMSINRITPRVFELRKLGHVEEYGKRPCKITGRTAIAWATSKQEIMKF